MCNIRPAVLPARKNTKFKWGLKENTAFEALKESITSEDTMAYFNPTRPIALRVEASYYEGLSAIPRHRQGTSTSTFHQPHYDGHGEEVQPDGEGIFSCNMGQESIQYVPPGSAKVEKLKSGSWGCKM